MRLPKNAPNLNLGPTLGESSTAALVRAYRANLPCRPSDRRKAKSEILRRLCGRRGVGAKRRAQVRAACLASGIEIPPLF